MTHTVRAYVDRKGGATNLPLDMWFRTLIKTAQINDVMTYKWHEMTFCLRWDSKCCAVLCLGVDSSFEDKLQDNLNHMWSGFQGQEPESLLAPLIEVIVTMYDQSVWSIRDVVRQVEKASYMNTRPYWHK